MSVSGVSEVSFGEELPVFDPDTSLANVIRFTEAAGWGGPRFTDHEAARKEGLPVYFGDATRPEVLATLGVDRARAVIVALDDARMALQIVALLRYVFPELKIFARAHDETHGEELRAAGADGVVPEISETAMKLAGSVLEGGA